MRRCILRNAGFAILLLIVNSSAFAEREDHGLADLRNHGSLPEDGFRRLIENVKMRPRWTRGTLSEVADLAIRREAQRELGIKGK